MFFRLTPEAAYTNEHGHIRNTTNQTENFSNNVFTSFIVAFIVFREQNQNICQKIHHTLHMTVGMYTHNKLVRIRSKSKTFKQFQPTYQRHINILPTQPAHHPPDQTAQMASQATKLLRRHPVQFFTRNKNVLRPQNFK